MTGFRTRCGIVLLGLASISGCGRTSPESRPADAPSPGVPGSATGPGPAPSRREALTRASADSVTDYPLTGVVKGVDAASRSVTIRHDAIPGFMPAMTMPFTLKDPAIFDDLRAGDEVEGTLHVIRRKGEVADYELRGLVVTRPAQAPGLTLQLGPDGQPSLTARPALLRPGDPVPDFAMTTQDGATVHLSDLKGKVVVLTFIYTRCPLPDFCPATDRKFSELADRISAHPDRAAKVRLLSVSFDPEHDTPAILREHARMRGAKEPLWTFAVASHAELSKVAPSVGLTYGPTATEVVHNLSTAVIGPDGRLVRLETGADGKSWRPADLLKAIYSRIAEPKG